MIHIPNLVAGAVLGFLLSLPFFVHERRERRREVGITWTKGLRRSERLIAGSKTSAQNIYDYFSNIPADHYRRVLGPEDFRMVEDLQTAYFAREKAEVDLKAIRSFLIKHSSVEQPRLTAMRSHEQRPMLEQYQAALQLEFDADPKYHVAIAQRIIRAQKLDALKVAVMDRGRERSRQEYGQLLLKEERAERRRHPIKWVTRVVKGWRRRRQSTKIKAANAAPPA